MRPYWHRPVRLRNSQTGNRLIARRRAVTARISGLMTVFLLTSCAATSLAGFGPENTLVVVNARSASSRTIANHFVDLRRIPPNNVIYIDWQESYEKTDIQAFRDQLLNPVLRAAEQRGIANQVDCIAWSTGFPFEIDFSKEGKEGGRFKSGSLTGLTYLYQMVLAGETDLLVKNNTNRYASLSADPDSSRGFRHHYNWTVERAGRPDKGQRYLLSTMLGYTHGRGNSVEQVVSYLRRSAIADGTHPDGTAYFMTNDDIRTKTRSPHFAKVVKAIRREGGKAEIETGNAPQSKTDVIGAMTGHASVRWDTKSKMLPGAISENLTSFGGILRYGGGQRPLTEFLEHGAVGSSGTVIEPYAVIGKFPHPVLHLHYRRGCTLAESFYGSIAAPYQLLVVGDPLCRPYADIPAISLAMQSSNSDSVVNAAKTGSAAAVPEVSGEVRLRPTVKSETGRAAKSYDLFVNGRRRQTVGPDEDFVFDSTKMPEGYHELRVVATMDDKIETLGRAIHEIMVNNRGRTINTKVTSPLQLGAGQQIRVEAESPDSRSIVVFQNQNVIGDAAGSKFSFSYAPQVLGYGPVQLRFAGLGNDKYDTVFAPPVDMEVIPNPLFRGRPSAISANLKDGLLLKLPNGVSNTVSTTAPSNWLKKAGAKPGDQFTMMGTVNVPRTSVYYLHVVSPAGVEILCDGIKLIPLLHGQPSNYEIPLLLEKGRHRLRLSGRADPSLVLTASFGETEKAPLMGPTFQHMP